jgi:hypothetical protein
MEDDGGSLVCLYGTQERETDNQKKEMQCCC